ncbi:MAG: alpha/beta hydrolase [Deltaproteobacteria bacterium]|nr:alpha/beta hydrolase [Kofleriaceae bacterium]
MAASAAFEAWHAGGATFRHRGHDIFYRADGSGPPLLAIHGFPSASWDWWPMWPALTARFRVVACDMIGFGWSAKPHPYPYSILDQADLHEALARELGLDEAHVLAHDYGDTVAQELLARHAEGGRLRLRSVCFLNGGLFPEVHRPRFIQKLLAGPIGPIVARLSTKRAFASGMTAIFGPRTPPSPELLDELWTLLEHERGRRVLPALIGYMAERRRHRERWVGALVNARVPLRVIDGPVDPVSGAHMVARYRELVRDPDTVELPGIGHYPQVEDPDGVLRAFVAFHETRVR